MPVSGPSITSTRPKVLDDFNSQSRAGVNLTHRFSERLRFSSQNFISYEMEPDYSYGYASTRTNGEYFFWQSDNSVGYRWTERLATYTGLRLCWNGLRFGCCQQRPLHLGTLQPVPLPVQPADGVDHGLPLRPDLRQRLRLGFHQPIPACWVPNIVSAPTPSVSSVRVPSSAMWTTATTPPVLISKRPSTRRRPRHFSLRSYARYGIEDYDTVQSFPTGRRASIPTAGRCVSGFPVNMSFNPMVLHVRRHGLHPDQLSRGTGGCRYPVPRHPALLMPTRTSSTPTSASPTASTTSSRPPRPTTSRTPVRISPTATTTATASASA